MDRRTRRSSPWTLSATRSASCNRLPRLGSTTRATRSSVRRSRFHRPTRTCACSMTATCTPFDERRTESPRKCTPPPHRSRASPILCSSSNAPIRSRRSNKSTPPFLRPVSVRPRRRVHPRFRCSATQRLGSQRLPYQRGSFRSNCDTRNHDCDLRHVVRIHLRNGWLGHEYHSRAENHRYD